MFKCSDCQKEYTGKPDYCDCGNNVFIEIEAQPIVKAIAEEANDTLLRPYPFINNSSESLDIQSTIIFVALIILSVISWFVIGSFGSNSTPVHKTSAHIVKNKSGVDINSFWNDTLQSNPVEKKIANSPSAPVVQEETQPDQDVEKSQPVNKIVVKKPQEQKIYQAPTMPIIRQSVAVKQERSKPETTYNPTQQEESMEHYLERLRVRINSNWNRHNLSGGQVLVQYKISRDGNLYAISIKNSSGYYPLEQSALRAVYASTHFDPPPQSYDGDYVAQPFVMERN